MKRKSTLLSNYKMSKGGFKKAITAGTNPLSDKATAGVGAIAGIGDGLLDSIDPTDKFGTRSDAGAIGSGALKGAAAGAQFGLIGMGVGALAGGVTGLLGNNAAQKAKQNYLTDESKESELEAKTIMDERVANDPTLKYGNTARSMYRLGGSLKGKPAGKFSIGKHVPSISSMSLDLMPDISIRPGGLVGKAMGGGVTDPEDIKNGVVKADDRQHWNGFVDYVASKGYAGKPELDSRDTKLSRKLFDDYTKSTGKAYQYDTYVPAIQKEIATYRDSSIKRIKAGQMAVTNDDGSIYKGDKKTYDYDNKFMPGLSNVDSWAGSKTTAWKFPKAYLTENGQTKEVPNTIYTNQKKKMGGSIKMAKGGVIPTSSDTTEIKGPSHANGGVKFPDMGVELEGGETTSGDFVFSKELGVAKIHNSVAKAMGRNEKKPDTVLNKNTQVALKRKEGFLKIYQEQMKRDMGIPNEIDNKAEEIEEANATEPNVMKNGGVMKMQDGGDPLARRKAIASRIKELKGQYRSYDWDNTKLTDAPRTEYRALLAENKALINGTQAPIPSVPQPSGFNGDPYNVPYKTTGAFNFNSPVSVAPKPSSVNRTVGTKRPGQKRLVTPSPITPQFPGVNIDPNATEDPSVTALRDIDPSGKSGRPIQLSSVPKLPIGSSTAESTAGSTPSEQRSIGDALTDIAPFASNIANSFRKLPAPPKPVMDSELTPSLISMDADRAEATRQRRGADRVAAQGIGSNNTVAAIKAANLTQDIRAVSQINQAENNANSQIKNQFVGINAQIRAGNNAKTNQYNTQQVERTIKQQQLDSENIANAGDKVQAIARDKKLFELDDTKNLLTILSDPTGATIRGAGPTLKRLIKDPAVYQQILDRGKEMERMNEEDRRLSLTWIKAQLKASGVPDDVLNTGKALSADAKTAKASVQTEYMKSRINKNNRK